MSVILTGNSNPGLFKKMRETLAKQSPFEIGRARVDRFSDGEIAVDIKDTIRGRKVYILQSTCSPVNDTIMELMVMADAVRRSAAKRIIAVMPYYGYARQDRRPGYSRTPITASLVARMLEDVGIDHLISLDLHATQILGFFKIPVDNISATNLFVADVYKKWMNENPIIVSPDVGGVARAREVAKHFENMELAIIDKRRPKANVSEVMNIIGDVEDKTCIIIDDLVDTAGTLAKAANALVEVGKARRVVAYATHGVLSGKAGENILNSVLEEVVITDSIPLKASPKIRVLSVANLLTETITRVDGKRSISAVLD